MSVPATVSEVLDPVLAEDPGRIAIVARHGTLTYGELDRAADAVAAVLADLGVRPGDRVAASLPNDLDIVTCFHGALRLGAIWTGVNQALAPPEKNELLAAAGPAVVLADPETAHHLGAGGGAVFTLDPDEPDGAWYGRVRAAAGTPRPPAPDPDAPAAVAYTSGTTGTPRGIVHAQRNLLLPGAALVHSRGYDASLVKGDFLPLSILNMMVLTTLLTAQAGGRAVLMDRRDAAGVAEWIDRHGVTVWNGVPALLYSMARDPEIPPERLRSLRDVWSGAADCPDPIRAAFEDRFGLPVHMTYGQTEAPSVVAIQPRGTPYVPGASGRPLPHLRVTVRDDADRELGPGEEGEICVGAADSGPWAGAYRPMLGFWRDTNPRAEAVRDGVLHTGDIGFLDHDGNVHVRDRKKLLIQRGGANVYPAEVERVLLDVPEVQACAVVPVADERLGQRVVAVVQPYGGAVLDPDALAAHCRRNLARYKVPERFAVVTDFARNAMGKIERAGLPALFGGPDLDTSRPVG